jgi:LCP family protein required for cell wall assembly
VTKVGAVTDDDGFGPVQRGRVAGEPATRATRPVPANPEPEGFGPPVRGRRRVRLPRLRPLLVLLLVLALLVPLTGVALALYTSARIERIDVQGLGTAAGRMNVLVVGSDSREGLTSEELQALGTEAVAGKRTDTIFLLSLSGGRAAMLSFPRDLFVTRCDGSQGRINAAFNAADGPSCLVQTVTQQTGIPVTHYLELNFVAFMRLVDAVGGVRLFLDAPMVDVPAGVNLPAGCVRLDGRGSLGFVRARQADNDLGRIARQQQFLRALAQEIAAPSTLVNVPRMFRVGGAAGSSLIADRGLGTLDLLRFARAARGLAGGGLAAYTVPATPANIGGAAVLVPAEAEAAAVFAQFRDGSVLHAVEVPAPPPSVGVRVLNGAGVSGLAAQAQAHLESRGFEVTGIGNAERVDRTVVQHAPGLEAAAQQVAAALPGAAVEEVAGEAPLTVVLGPDASFEAPPPAEDVPAPAEPAPAPDQAPAPLPVDC